MTREGRSWPPKLRGGIRNARQQSLEESEERFRTLVEYAAEAMVILDADSGRFVDANDNACRLFGLPRDALLRRGPADVSPELQPNGERSAVSASEWIRKTVEGRLSVFEWVHENAAGERIACEIRLVRLPYKGRRRIHGSILDISHRKAAETERQRLTAELAQAQKLQAIGQLTGGIAHDFNNLLTVIMSSLEMIEAEAGNPQRVRSFATQATAAAQRAAALTRRLLAFARRQPLHPQAVDVNRLLSGLEGLLSRTLGESIAVRTRPAEGLWTCTADPAQLENVILNLAINARDAMPGGGELIIETANTVLDAGEPRRGTSVAGDCVMVAVSDNGTGMVPEVLDHVFEPFFTTKEVGRGSGLGLSTIYGFAKQSGGHVTIQSEPGRGTTVRVYLPRSGSSAAATVSQPAPDVTPSGHGELVLVVEDDAAVRALVASELHSLGYRTALASGADDALERLGAAPEVALLLTDMVLAETENGPELAQRARTMRPSLPVLFMSGYAADAIAEGGGLEPDVPLLQKPFTRHDLALAVRQVLQARAGG